jgi:hypothetical protein
VEGVGGRGACSVGHAVERWEGYGWGGAAAAVVGQVKQAVSEKRGGGCVIERATGMRERHVRGSAGGRRGRHLSAGQATARAAASAEEATAAASCMTCICSKGVSACTADRVGRVATCCPYHPDPHHHLPARAGQQLSQPLHVQRRVNALQQRRQQQAWAPLRAAAVRVRL